MFNKVVLVGNLTRDIELKYLQSGTAVGNSAIATSRKFKSTSGEQKEEVCFIDIAFFGRSAEIANQYLKKGSKILVEGRLKLDQWTDQNGAKRSKHSIIVENMQMLGGKSDEGANSYVPPSDSKPFANESTQTMQTPIQEQSKSIPEIDIDDDEIPF
jgi:single-strand DNA-binding protein